MPLDDIITKYGSHKGALIPILQGIQKEYRYLPQEVLREVCSKTKITPADIFSVSTFYDQFRHTPSGKHSVCVCTGTACHVKGADRVLQKIHQTLEIDEDSDTDANRQFTIQKVACLGCCTLAPVVQIDGITYGHLTPETVPHVLNDFKHRFQTKKSRKCSETKSADDPKYQIAAVRIGLGSCCQAQGSALILDEVTKTVREFSLDIRVEGVGCVGMCHQTPLLEAVTRQGVATFYAKVRVEDVRSILLQNYKPKNFFARTGHRIGQYLEALWSGEIANSGTARILDMNGESTRAFLDRQHPTAMLHCGTLNPNSLNNYRKHGGFDALRRILNPKESHGERSATDGWTSNEIIDRLERSGLRGRGGAGFPTYLKWLATIHAAGTPKYVVCNGDEGDPGAFMDRMLIESFPFRIIEGMTIAAKAVGASKGFLYIRAEYPLALERMYKAIELCYANRLLGENIFNTNFSFDLSIQEGAGAFICGEETALLESMEGRRGTPRLKPPFPANFGLYGQPTLINNVETFALIPPIFVSDDGLTEFAGLGTEKSKGTKVFALAGKIRRGGLIEVPMGVTLRQIVDEIGGGIQQPKESGTKRSAVPCQGNGRKFKAVQIGGPSGGCVPASLADTPVDFESLSEVGAIMGSGGLIVLDDQDCMVDIARYFLKFTQEQSCGKCTFCRVGTRRMLDILNRLCEGQGKPEDLEALETLAEQIKSGSLCGLGKTAPNPVLSTLRYFRSEYEAHVRGECPAGKCSALIQYKIDENCNGCSMCVQHCPVSAISAKPYRRHSIDTSVCTKCDACRQNCPHDAVAIVPAKSMA